MNLQSGKLYWPDTIDEKPSYQRVTEDLVCDVLIIGGGSSGAQCAYYLSKHDINVVVVDKREVGSGSTSTNTALIQYSGDKMFYELIHSFGEDRATRHLKLCQKAINEMETISKQLPINPHFIRRDSVYLASNKDDLEKLKIEYDLLKKHQFPVEYMDEAQLKNLYQFNKPGAIYSLNDAELNPLAFTYGLLEAAREKGVQIFEHTPVVGKKWGEDGVEFFTDNHYRIKANKVIIAAGYESLDFHLEKNATITSSYAIISNPVSNLWHNRALIWETARPYFYMRTTPDQRIIFGGLDETTAYSDRRDSMLLHKRDLLIENFNTFFPDISITADYYLSAFYGGTHDGMPIIGLYDQYPHCYFLYGYGDNGTVYTMVFAKIIDELMIDNKSSNLDLYIQTRPLAK